MSPVKRVTRRFDGSSPRAQAFTWPAGAALLLILATPSAFAASTCNSMESCTFECMQYIHESFCSVRDHLPPSLGEEVFFEPRDHSPYTPKRRSDGELSCEGLKGKPGTPGWTLHDGYLLELCPKHPDPVIVEAFRDAVAQRLHRIDTCQLEADQAFNHVECERKPFQSGPPYVQCALAERVAVGGDAIYDFVNGHTVGTDFTITYSLDCPEPVRFGVRAEHSSSEFEPTGAETKMVKLTGASSLELWDGNPHDTRQKQFGAKCALRIPQVFRTPSPATVASWSTEAGTQRKILEYALSNYQLMKDYEALHSWDTSKLTLLRQRLESLQAANPEELSYKILLATVVAALNNQPAPHGKDETGASYETVLANARKELVKEFERAQKIQDRFVEWQESIDEALRRTMDEIAQALQSS